MLLIAKDRETARTIGMELVQRNVAKTYIAAGFDRAFSKKRLPDAGIIRSRLARVWSAFFPFICRWRITPANSTVQRT